MQHGGVEATLRDEVTSPELPASAILIGNDGSTHAMVFVPSGDDTGVIEQRKVGLVPARDASFRIIEGLEAGELVVVTGVSRLSDGQQVRRFTGFAN